MNSITIRVKHYLDGVYMYVGILLAMAGLIFLLFEPLLAIVFILLSILVFSTVYKLTLYKNEKLYYNYLWFLGIKIGKKVSYGSIDNLLITKNRYKKKLNTKGSRTVVEYNLYKGFIVFDNNNKVLLGESKNPVKIEKRVSWLREQLGVEVLDMREN